MLVVAVLVTHAIQPVFTGISSFLFTAREKITLAEGLVRALIDNGQSPTTGDTTPAYILLGLNQPGGGLTVIPRGSDGVVDYASMAANGPSVSKPPNVYDVPAAPYPSPNDISHSGPIDIFGSTVDEVNSTVIAYHVIDTLDQNGQEAPENTRFGSFPVPPLVADSVRQQIDAFAAGVVFTTPEQLLAKLLSGKNSRRRPLETTLFSYQLDFPGDQPPAGNVQWLVELYGTNGVTTDNITWSAGGLNQSQITLSVPQDVPGDVVVYAWYQDASNEVVLASAQVVASQSPAGAAQTNIAVLPFQPTVPVGSEIPVQMIALYSNGSSCARFVTPDEVTVISSDPSIVTVTNALLWQTLSPGTAQVVATWAGFSVTNQVTGFVSGSASPTLAVQNNGGARTLSWPLWAGGFILESNGDLSVSDGWRPVGGTPATNNQEINFTVPISSRSVFFRLRR